MSVSRALVPAALMIALLLACLAFLWAPVAAQEKDKIAPVALKWDKVIEGVRADRMEEELNALGMNGWECVATVSQVEGRGQLNTRGILICKRPKR